MLLCQSHSLFRAVGINTDGDYSRDLMLPCPLKDILEILGIRLHIEMAVAIDKVYAFCQYGGVMFLVFH